MGCTFRKVCLGVKDAGVVKLVNTSGLNPDALWGLGVRLPPPVPEDIMENEKVICAECGSEMVLRDSKYGKFYGCSRFPVCRGAHGAHPNGKPLGTPATRKTKMLRMQAHSVFDCWWKQLGLKKNEAYKQLSRIMDLPRKEAHIGMFDAEQCRHLIERIGQGGF